MPAIGHRVDLGVLSEAIPAEASRERITEEHGLVLHQLVEPIGIGGQLDRNGEEDFDHLQPQAFPEAVGEEREARGRGVVLEHAVHQPDLAAARADGQAAVGQEVEPADLEREPRRRGQRDDMIVGRLGGRREAQELSLLFEVSRGLERNRDLGELARPMLRDRAERFGLQELAIERTSVSAIRPDQLNLTSSVITVANRIPKLIDTESCLPR